MKTLMDFLQLFGINVNITESSSPIYLLACCIFVLNIVGLFCFINVTGYFISIYLINKYNVEERYPKYQKLIRYFEKSRILFVITEIILCLFCLIISKHCLNIM